MFIDGYILDVDVDKIKSELDKTNYLYRICLIDKTFENSDSKQQKLLYVPQWKIDQPAGIEKKPWMVSLARVYVEDPIITNRDLYKQLIDIFQTFWMR